MCPSFEEEDMGEEDVGGYSLPRPFPQLWQKLVDKPTCLAIFSFRGSEIIPNHGLDLDLGDAVIIIEQCGEWYRGYVTTLRNKVGIFPVSYVKLKGVCQLLSWPQSSVSLHSLPTTSTDPASEKLQDNVVKEIVVVAREWGEIWKRLYVEGGASHYQWEVMGRGIKDLVDGRRQLITGTLTQDQLREIKLRLTSKIDWGNRRLGLDLVPRIGCEVVNPENFGAVQLYHIHLKSVENAEAARGTVRKKRKSIFPSHKAIGHHLFMSVRDFPFVVSDDSEVYFSLYDAQRSQYITERFMVKFSREGMSNFVDKVQSQSVTIFEDLGYADLTKDLFLVAHVIRIGKMFHSESTKKSSQLYKRSYAGGILNIGDVVSQTLLPLESMDDDGNEGTVKLNETSTTLLELEPEKEFSFKIYTCDEKDFSQLHDFLVKKQMGKVSVLSVSGQPVQTMVALKMFHGDITTIRTENPSLLKNTVGTRKLGFPDVIMPGDVRNDMYITLDHGEFEKSGKNIEVTALVLDSEGCILHGAVYGAVSSTGLGSDQYQSVILYHTNVPKWGETIRLTVPIEAFPTCHLRLEYRHCSTKEKNDKKLCGFSFAKLMDDEGTTLKDGVHDLHVYKCDDRLKLKDPLNYLKLPSSGINSMGSSMVVGNQTFQRSLKENMCVSTFLVSTKLTQNMDLVSLLKWKSHPEKMNKTLKSIAQLSGEEIVKFLQDVLDVLFSMFLNEEGESNEFSGDVFIVLINIFSILEDVKFEHFKPVIEAYITDHFAAALVYKGLLCTVRHYAEVIHQAEKEFFIQIQKCFETLEFIFKFIIQSHVLFTRATGGEINDSFSKDVFDLFISLNKMFSDCNGCVADSLDIIPIQSSLMSNFKKMYTELLKILPSIEVTKLVVGCFASIKLKESAHPLSPSKLIALHHLVKSSLFADKESRGIILPEVCKHLRHHLACREELKLCTDVLGDILTFLYAHSKKMDNRIHDDIETLATSTLEKLVQSILVLERTSSVVGNLVSCLIGLLQLMDQYHYNRLWDEFCERKPLHDVIQRVLLVFRDLIKQDVFPKDWINMKLLTDSIMLKSMNELSQPLVLYFLNKCWFDNQLWNQYFTLAVTFLTQPTLQLQTFRETKRDSILQRYGDMRVQMGFQILAMWSNLGENKINFIPTLVGPFLEVTLIPEMELRKATLNIFYDMLEVEQSHRGNFKQVECELIDKLDLLVSENKGDDEYRQLFNSVLIERLKECNQTWQSSGVAFVHAVTRLMERLLDYRNVLQGDENRDKRMSCTVNLLEFYKTEINRREMYLRYIYKLHDLHYSAENFTEAGFTLLLHTEMLEWSNDNLSSEGPYPIQTEMERKEMIYLKIIQYFDQGKVWEKGIPLCKELCQLHESKSYEYEKLSHLLMTQAKFFENIMNQLRPDPEYFRVGFFGRGFPLFVRNKEFIYRGLEYERLGPFMQRVLTEWPSAHVLNNIPPDESILTSDGHYIQICSVKPVPDPKNPVLGAHVPEKIQSYFAVNNVNTFQFDRRLHKFVHDDPDNEFKNMWVERTTMTTSAHLPGILRWFDVIHKKIEELTPVRIACEKMEDANRQLSSLIGQYLTESQRNVNPLSMRLSGILDAAVMGGIPKYRDAFFTPEFLHTNPDATVHVSKLRTLILEQVTILENGLSVHGRYAPPGVQPLHKRLLECFNTMKTTVQADFNNYSPTLISKSTTNLRRSESQRDSFRKNVSLSSIVNTPLPPVPVGIKKLTVESSTSNRSSNSSGYGHLINSLFDHSDDEDVYSKPGEMKLALSTPPTSLFCVSTNNIDENSQVGNNMPAPPPIPNRTSKRSSNAKVQHQLSTSPTVYKPNEYILMPPSRARELSDQKSIEEPTDTHHSLSDSFHTVDGSPANQNSGLNGNPNSINSTPMSNIEEKPPGTYFGPPLPPKSSLSENKVLELNPTETPPVLPKRQPKKPLLTQMNSFNSDTPSRSSTPSTLNKAYANDSSKTPPPVPPKPNRSSSATTTITQPIQNQDTLIQSETPYMNKNEINSSLPSSPSYEEQFEKNALSDETISNPSVMNKDTETCKKLDEIKTPVSITIERSSSSMSQRRSHKEYYTLPLRNPKTGTKE